MSSRIYPKVSGAGEAASVSSPSSAAAPTQETALQDALGPNTTTDICAKESTAVKAAADASMDATTDDVVVYHYTDDYDGDASPLSSEWDALRNKNVSRVLVFCFLDGASHSIWRMDPFQVLIKLLAGDKAVGWMSGISGITQMLSAVVAGYIGNRVKHEVVLRCGSVVGFITVAMSMIAAAKLSVPLFFVSQALCGVYAGISATTMEALFADSVASGRRAFVYNLKWMDQVLCQCVGLIICICVLSSLGNVWKESALVKTMFVGLCLHPCAMLMLWTLRDKYSLKEEDDVLCMEAPVVLAGVKDGDAEVCGDGRMRKSASEVRLLHRSLHDDDAAEEEAGTATATRAATEDTPWSSGQGRPSATRPSGSDSEAAGKRRVHWSSAPPVVVATPTTASPTPTAAAAAEGESPASSAASPSGRPPRSTGQKAVQAQLEEECEAAARAFHADMAAAHGDYLRQLRCVLAYGVRVVVSWEAVPYLVCLVDFLVAFGSGMTMRYMSLFFVVDYKTSPVMLLTASLMVSPLTAIFSFLVQRGGDYYVGRLPSTIIVRLIGTTLLLLMGTTTLPLNIMLPIYIVRNALMNSTAGVTRSVIMDCVRKENRAKWSAFESFSSFTWSGSAVFGGYIAAAHGYKGTFKITAFFHYCSLAVLVPGAIGALPVERELVRSNRRKPHASCLMVTVAVSVNMIVASGVYVWFRS